MGVLDIIEKRKKELSSMRKEDTPAYIKTVTSGLDNIKSLLGVKTQNEGVKVVEDKTQVTYKSKPESLLETIATESQKSTNQLVSIADELTRQRKTDERNRIKDLGKKVKPTVIQGADSGGGLLDMIPDSLGKGKFGKVGGFLAKNAGKLAAGTAVAYNGYNAISALNDDTLTDEQKSQKVGGAAGSTAGMLIGGALGSLAGPAGTMVGGLIGSQIGESIGDRLGPAATNTYKEFKTYMHNDLGPAVVKTMDSVDRSVNDSMSSIGSMYSTLKDQASDVFHGLSEAGSYIKDGFSKGWDELAKGGGEAFDKLKDAYKSGGGFFGGLKNVAAALPSAASSLGEGASKAAFKVTSNAKDAASIFKGSIDTANARTSAAAGERKQAIEKALTDKGVTDPKARAIMMANMDHETGGFTKVEENLNYSSVERIRKTFDSPTNKNKAIASMSDEQLKGLVNNPEALANTVYGGRMGNTEAGDGFKYRGRGGIQVTGKAEYERLGKKLGIDLVNNPDLLLDPDIGAKASVEYLTSKKGVLDAATAGDSTRVRQLVNGGQIGAEDVNSKIAKYEDQYTKNPAVATAQTVKPETLAKVTPVTSVVPGQPSVVAAVSSTQSSPVVNVPQKSIVDRPVPLQQTVEVANMPEQTAQEPNTTVVASSGGGGTKPRLSEIPIHITDQGLVLVQTGIV